MFTCIDFAMRPVHQGLLYIRERDLRRCQLSVQELQARLAWWEANTENPEEHGETGPAATCRAPVSKNPSNFTR